MPHSNLITTYDSLLDKEGDTVHVMGTFNKYNALPNFGPTNAVYRPGILLQGDSVPKLFLFNQMTPAEMDKFDGKRVTVTGVFARVQRSAPGDPEEVNLMSGSWLYDVQGPNLKE
jgi:hypothetical protein